MIRIKLSPNSSGQKPSKLHILHYYVDFHKGENPFYLNNFNQKCVAGHPHQKQCLQQAIKPINLMSR